MNRKGELLTYVLWLIPLLIVGGIIIYSIATDFNFSDIFKNLPGFKAPAEEVVEVTELIPEVDSECLIEQEENKEKLEPFDKDCLHTSPEDTALLSRLSKYDKIIKEASIKYGVEEDYIKSIIVQESSAYYKVKSSVGCKGLMQICPGAAEDADKLEINKGLNLLKSYNKNPYDPKTNIFIGTSYFANLIKYYNEKGNEPENSVKLALVAYNHGRGNVNLKCENGLFENCDISTFPEETKNYVSGVLGYYQHFKSGESA